MHDLLWILKYATPGIHNRQSISKEEAKALLRKYDAAFPQIVKYRESITQELRR